MVTEAGPAGQGPVPPDLEVWNRSTTGVPWSGLPGDVALAHALRLDGYAAAGSVLGGLEIEISEGWGDQGREGFAWFDLAPVVALLDEAGRAYRTLTDGDLEGEAHAQRYEQIDQEMSVAWDALDVTGLLTAALRRALVDRPGAFGPTTGVLVEPRVVEVEDPDAVEPVQRLLGQAPAGGAAGFARAVPAEEKARRSARALSAFGFDAEVEDGHVVLQPWADEEDELLHAVLALLDLRYPDA